jgi:DNA polymerase-4
MTTASRWRVQVHEEAHMTPAPDQGFRRVMHCDLDCFFAAVEELDNPSLAGRPVIVGGDPDRRGVVSTANYAARRFGVRSAMAASVAHRLCPEALFLRPRFDRYRALSQRIMTLLDEYFVVREQVSIDEAYGELPPGRPGCRRAEEIARELKARVRTETGLVISVGVARSKSLAKIASDLGKPDGCVIVRPGKEEAFLAPLPVSRLSGVGPQTRERLERLDIATIGQLAATGVLELERHFGKHGRWLWQLANGRDDRLVVAEHGPPKSVSCERTYERDIADAERAMEQLRGLAAETARRARREGVHGRTVVLKVRWADFRLMTRHQALRHATNDAGALEEAALAQFLGAVAPRLHEGAAIRLLGVGLSNLAVERAAVESSGMCQLQLWPEDLGAA